MVSLLFLFFLQFNIYSFAPLPVRSAESEGEDVWRRDGFFKGGCQHQVGRTGTSISAGITLIIPGFLSNASPSPPASSWVSLEGEEQEPELILERRAHPPASLG